MMQTVLMTATSAGASGEIRPTQQPLTMDVLERCNGAIDVATEVRSRLYSLRDRIFGPPPPAADAAAAKPASEPHSFADAVEARQRVLRYVLGDIEALSNELSNRL